MYGQKYTYEEWPQEWKLDKYAISMPKKPAKVKVANYGVAKKNQKFRPPDQDYVKQVSRRYNRNELTEEDKEFIKEEWRRRREGYWFFNNGNLEYITGVHYFYLSYYKFPVEYYEMQNGKKVKIKTTGLPQFRDSDRDYFYIWQHCVLEPNCYGMVHVTNRRDGKTFRGNCTNYEVVTRRRGVLSAIQSKTGADAKVVFKKLVKSWKSTPSFFKPIDSGDTDPSHSLRFFEPARRSSKNVVKEYADTLDSEITYYNSKEEALDGLDLVFVMHDEVGKTNPKEADVDVRWGITKECLVAGSTVTGKALLTTTVEEMEKKGGKQLKRIWDKSDITNPDSVNELGQTSSGLYSYFKPAYYGLAGEDQNGVPFVDEYGYSDIERTKDFLLKKKSSLKGEDLAAENRKYPFTENDAFFLSSNTETFPSFKIREQIDFNDALSTRIVRRGNFMWMDSKREAVEFRDDPKGKFFVQWMPSKDERNLTKHTKKGLSPIITNNGAIGVDPFDHNETVNNKKSDAGIHGFLGFNAVKPTRSNMFVFEYIHRPSTSREFYEDVIKACVFYGWQALVENQKIGCINYMRDNGFGGYVMQIDKSDTNQSSSSRKMDGISTSGTSVRDQLVDNLYTYIYNYVGLIDKDIQLNHLGIPEIELMDDLYGSMPFKRTLEDWLNFDYNNWTDYDATVSSMIAYTAVRGIRDRSVKKPNKKENRVKLFSLR